MEQIRQFYDQVQDLDRRQLISISHLKRWAAYLAIVFVIFNYAWNSLFSNMRDTHIPFALLPPELQYKELKLPFRSAEEIRNSQINQINFVIFACALNEEKVVDESSDMFALTVVAKEAIRTMKSATIFTRKIIHFHIFTEDRLYQAFIAELDKWPNNVLHRVTFEFHAASYPEAILEGEKDKQTQKACDLSFLFIPSIVKDLDFAIYSKTGAIFLSPIDELWMNFRDYNEVNSLALPLQEHAGISSASLQHKDLPAQSVEKIFETTIIQYDVQRLQTGLFKVPISRKSEFQNHTWFPINTDHFQTVEMTWNPTMILGFYNFFKSFLKSPGVDLINLIAFFNPDKIYMLPCDWHFDVTSCSEVSSQCPNAKVLIQNEAADQSKFNPEFVELAQLFDDIDLNHYNMTQVIESVLSFKNSVFMQWPYYSLCSLQNMNAVKFL